MSDVVRISVPLAKVERGPEGQRLAATEGLVNAWRFDVTVTESEMHFSFADRGGPSFSVSLNALAQEATNAIEFLITGTRAVNPKGTR